MSRSRIRAVVRSVYLERSRDVFWGTLFELPGSRLGPLEDSRVELTAFVAQERLISNHDWSLRREGRDMTKQTSRAPELMELVECEARVSSA